MNKTLRTMLMAGLLSPLYSMAATQPAAATLTPVITAMPAFTSPTDSAKSVSATAPQLLAAADTKKKTGSDDGDDSDSDDDDDDTQ